MAANSTDNPAVPLRRLLGVRVGLLVAAAVLLAGLMVFEFGMGPMATQVAESQFSAAGAEVVASLDNVFRPTERFLLLTRQWVAAAPPDLETPDAFNRLFQPILEGAPEATSAVAGTADGDGWMLLQRPDGSWMNRLTSLKTWDNRHLFFERSAGGSVNRYWKAMDYDPRLRAWYVGAVGNKKSVYWTAPYIFFTTRDVGITASVFAPTVARPGLVIGIDLMLRDLSATTMAARVGKRGLALVITDDRRALALPAAPAGVAGRDWLGRIMQPAASLGIAPLSDALSKWSPGSKREVTDFRSGGATWLERFHPYGLGNQRFWVVILAPKADFEPNLLPIAGVLAGGLALMLLGAGILARRLARNIATPLESLALASERVGQLEFTARPVIRSQVAELNRLADAHENMRRLLQDNQSRIAGQQEALRKQVDALNAAEEELRERQEYTKVLFSDSRIPLVVLDRETSRIIDCNQAAVEIYRAGHRDAVVGLSVADVSAPYQYDGAPSGEAAALMIRQALRKGSVVFEWRHRRPSGEEWDAEVHLMTFRHRGMEFLQFSLQDITERKRAAEALEQLALYDPLTGLPNRVLFRDRLAFSIAAARRKGSSMAVLYLDLDRFKEVNDTQGHLVGDEVLREVAHRFRAVLREGEMLARLGGDEFAVVATSADRHAAAFIAERIVASLDANITVSQHVFSLGVSTGIALFPDDGDTPDILLRKADIAMYRAKESGRGFEIYDPDMSSGIAERMAMAQDLKAAIAGTKGRLSLCYQPQLDLHSGALIGAEALLRWQHPTRGAVSPGEFIPIAEERGMMVMVGDWVLREACRQLADWKAQGLILPGRLAINVAAQQVGDAGFPERALRCIQGFGLEAMQFDVEITESGMMQNMDLSVELLGELKARGFRLTVDDFGTGYSSLAYLKLMPFEKLKIDMSFVRDMMQNVNDHAIVATIIGMGRTLGLRTIAEGVETQSQAEALRALGCEEGQGYLFGFPEPADAFAARWLKPAPDARLTACCRNLPAIAGDQ